VRCRPFILMVRLGYLVALWGALGCGASTTWQPDAITARASEALLLQDGTLRTANPLPSSLEEPAEKVRALIARHASTHTIRVSPNGLALAITQDGLGLDLLHRAGLKSGIISGRHSKAVEQRADALGISFVHLGCSDKVEAFEATLAQAGLTAEQVAFVGDDLNDVPLLLRAALAVAVADANHEAKVRAHYVTAAKGGRGAVRETVELILKAQDRWHSVVEHYLS